MQVDDWEYVDGSLAAHNPMEMLIREVISTRPQDITPRIVISIGSGKTKQMSGSKSSPLDLWIRHGLGVRTYFRFDVEDGLETIKRDEWRVKRIKGTHLLQPSAMQRPPRNKTLDTITKHTLAYISTNEVQEQISHCADILVEARQLRFRFDPSRWEQKCYGSTGFGYIPW